MTTATVEQEGLVSADIHVFLTDYWVEDQLRKAGVSETDRRRITCDNVLKACALD